MVIWIIGLSASGKTTLGREIYKIWKKKCPNTVLVDGDEIRKIFKHDQTEQAYTIEERKKNADRICELCSWLDKQDINVVCCILSLFPESQVWNRNNYSRYFEVFIDVPLYLLKKREIKGFYNSAISGKIKNVVGIDIPFFSPKNPDYIFKNIQDNIDMKNVANDILNKVEEKYGIL